MKNRVLIVGAGLAGCTVARVLADAGIASLVIDARDHVAGMCYSSVDEETQVEVHRFGPHIFHTSNEEVWDFVRRFDDWCPWINRVKATNARGVFSMPINLHTINQLFKKNFSPAEALSFIESQQHRHIEQPQNAEEQLLRFVGTDIYETFFRDYSTKQWGVSPQELSADIIKRIPVRFNYDDNYYFDRYQGFPMSGYTGWISRILDHELIEVQLGVRYEKHMKDEALHLFFSGPLDEYFDYAEGELSYRTVDFRYERGQGELQGCGCLNYTDMSQEFTRAHEHRYFSPWQNPEKSVMLYEYSREASREDDRFYPKRMPQDMERLQRYVTRGNQEEGVSFIGRLGCYKYFDMHHVIEVSLRYAQDYLNHKEGKTESLSHWAADPLS